jgi:SPP1 gp7 family putative phage head morphogenesis protein
LNTNTAHIESFEAEQDHFDEDFIAKASRLFMTKTGMTRAEFDLLDEDMKVRAFTVSYVDTVDRVLEIQKILDKAIADGTTLSKFQEAVTEHLDSHPWHVETVFRTNVQTAYGAAHWERAQELRSLRPYARYTAVMDGRTRPTHRALHGLVYPIDHPFWKMFWPPIGFNCRCHAVTFSQMELEEDGLTPQVAMPNVQPDKGFQSPAARGIKINPVELLSTRVAKMHAEDSVAVHQAITKGIEKIKNPVLVNMDDSATPQFMQVVTKAYEAMPAKVKDLLEESGTTIKVGDFVTNIKPDLKGVAPRGWPEGSTWDNVTGFHNRPDKVVAVSEYYRPMGTPLSLKESYNPVGTLYHEIGHALDHGFADKTTLKVSETSYFLEAYQKDVKMLKKRLGDQGGIYDGTIHYLLQSGEAGPQEAVAELISAILGNTSGTFSPRGLAMVMRNSYKAVKSMLGL